MREKSFKALYVHVPFCVRKCAYCDFASAATRRDDPRMARYVDAIVSEIDAFASVGLLKDSLDTAYVGGGTPTLLGAHDLSRLISRIPRARELTFEANPDSLSDQVIEAAVASGATRVSCGVQSLSDRELASLGRIHTADVARDRVRAVVESPLDVSVDLMCAIPEQSDASFASSLNEVISWGVDHVSVYPLAIEEGTELHRRYEHEETPFNDEDVEAARMEIAERVMTEAGYVRYEVASYARPHKRCAHNISYWTGVPYLGLGTAASSMMGIDQYVLMRELCPQLPKAPTNTRRVRLTVTSSATEIISDFRPSSLSFDLEYLTEQQAWAEDLMLSMRLTDGVDRSRFESCKDTLEDLLGLGLVEEAGNVIRPTHQGWLLGNELYGPIWDLAEGQVLEASC